jgi:hypothetical protein
MTRSIACSAPSALPRRPCQSCGVCHGCGGRETTEHAGAHGPLRLCAACVAPPLIPRVREILTVRRIDGGGPCPCGSRRYWRAIDRITKVDGSRKAHTTTIRICADCYPPPTGREVETLVGSPATEGATGYRLLKDVA